jgi:hypothetical protein
MSARISFVTLIGVSKIAFAEPARFRYLGALGGRLPVVPMRPGIDDETAKVRKIHLA